MKLDELTGYRASPVIPAFKTAMRSVGPGTVAATKRKGRLMDFLIQIEDMGFEAISNGSFGAVFTHPGIDYVIKIFKDDPSYLAFLGYVLAYPNDPALPRLRGKPVHLGADHWAVRLERLQSMPKSDVQRVLFTGLQIALTQNLCYDLDEFRAWLGKRRTMAGEAINPLIRMKAVGLLDKNPELFSTLQELAKQQSKSNGLDLHPGNFMMRGSVIVVVDPFADVSRLDVELERDLNLL